MDSAVIHNRLHGQRELHECPQADDQTCTSTGQATRADGAAATEHAAEGRYTVSAEFARGGLGRILRAHDQLLDRPVAIKEALTVGGNLDVRFRREASITARLQHPCVVPVHDAGTWTNGAPYYVMKLLSGGRTLKQRVAETQSLADRLALLPNVIAVANAMAYAHSLNIIHRDLKPSNVLVGEFGETLVIDWGLAKDLARPAADDELSSAPYRASAGDLTVAGTIIGTPQYMAPEQALGEVADKRSDVYSLGAVLYFVLSGCAPFSSDSPSGIIELVRSSLPIPLEERTPGVPMDLAAIVRKAMARAAEDRYLNAQELIEDLERFQTGQLVRAQEYSSAKLALRWIRRHRSALAVALLFLLAGAATALVEFRRIARSREQSEQQRAAAVTKRNELILLQAQSAMEHDPTRTVAWLKTYPLDGVDWPRVQLLAAESQSLGIARHFLATGPLNDAAVLPDGKRLVIAGDANKAELWNLETGTIIASLALPGMPIDVAASPDGTNIAIAVFNGDIILWDADSRVSHLVGHQSSAAVCVRFSPDGRHLASAGLSEFLVWDLKDKTVSRLSGHVGVVETLLFSPDGNTLFSKGSDGRLIRTSLIDENRLVMADAGQIAAVAMADDGLALATVGRDGSVKIWPLDGHAPRRVGQTSAQTSRVLFLPKSHQFVSGGHDRIVSLWDWKAGFIRQSPLLSGSITEIELNPNDSIVGIGDEHGQVVEWNPITDESRSLRGHEGRIDALAFSIDGSLISGGLESTTRVWTALGRPKFHHQIASFSNPVNEVILSPDAKSTASDNAENLEICAVASGRCHSLAGHRSTVFGIEYSPDGKQVLTAGWDGTARLWNVDDGRSRVFQTAGAVVRRALFSRDGRHVFVASTDGTIYVWSVDGGSPTLLRGHASAVTNLAVSPGGDTLASVGTDRTVRVWDWTSGTGRVLGTDNASLQYVAYSPDGVSLATGSADGTARLWNLSTSSSRVVANHKLAVSGLQFSGDGRFLASTSSAGTVEAWDLIENTRRVLGSHDGPVATLSWMHEHHVMATSSDDRTVRIWNLDTGSLEVLRGNVAPVRRIGFSIDDSSLVTSSSDHSIGLWHTNSAEGMAVDSLQMDTWMASSTTATIP